MTPINSSASRYRMTQVVPEMPSAPSLPLTVIERIADLSFDRADAASRISLKGVSKDFRDLDITSIRRQQWEMLLAAPQSGIVDIAAEMRYIESTFVQNPLDSIDRYTHLFRRLMSVFHTLGVPMERGAVLKTSPADYRELQSSLQSQQLKLCWPEMKRKISIHLGCYRCFYRIPEGDADASTIRSFLEKDSVRKAILSVDNLQLDNLGLVSLPKEMLLFSNLKVLNLLGNQFLSLPTQSFIKRIVDPAIPYVFNQVPAFPRLETLAISSIDRFPSLPFRGVTAIPSMNVFPSLTYVKFDIPTLTTLSSIEWLRQDGRGAHEGLTISLTGSKVYEYMMDKEYRPIAGDEIIYSMIDHLRNYRPTSPLGQLYHTMLYTDATILDLQGLIDLLPEGDRNLIYLSIWKYSPIDSALEPNPINWGREHCFTDEHLLRKCIGLSIQEKFMQIQHRDRDRRLGLLNRVYQNLWDQYHHREPVFEEMWARQARFNNFARLADAMSTIDIGEIEYLVFDNHWRR
ncbi:MAG: hypothetical protein NTX49_04720 [Chlamydiae bacterium]|nr:hypothetical protein [Chlamydiota bacterium]